MLQQTPLFSLSVNKGDCLPLCGACSFSNEIKKRNVHFCVKPQSSYVFVTSLQLKLGWGVKKQFQTIKEMSDPLMVLSKCYNSAKDTNSPYFAFTATDIKCSTNM